MDAEQIQQVASSTNDSPQTSTRSARGSQRVQMRQQLGLLDATAIILGLILGSGIFISPKGVLKNAGSVGLTLIVWFLSGCLSLMGALCYSELGTALPVSGGDYAYIYAAFGPLPAFLFLWAAIIVIAPTYNAIVALTTANYIIKPFFEDYENPDAAVRLLAAVAICFLTILNCYDVRIMYKLQTVLLYLKISALGVVVVTGLVGLSRGMNDNFRTSNVWTNTTTEPGDIAASFYSGFFTYAGWNCVNFMTEELKNPHKNLPRAAIISLSVVTGINVLVNVAYFGVLTPAEILESDAIAVTLGNKMLGPLSWTMSVFVATCTLGSLSANIMTSSRLCFVGARQGHLPDMLALINVNSMTPIPALIFLGTLSLVMLCVSDVYQLIDYSSFVESMFVLWSVAGLVVMRYTKPNLPRPIKVQLWIPLVFLLICGFLVFLPIYVRPLEVGIGLLITASGVPVYFFGVWWKDKPVWLKNMLRATTRFVQILTLCVQETKLE